MRRFGSRIVLCGGMLAISSTALAQWSRATMPTVLTREGHGPPTAGRMAPEHGCEAFTHNKDIAVALAAIGSIDETATALEMCARSLEDSTAGWSNGHADIHLEIVQAKNALRLLTRWATRLDAYALARGRNRARATIAVTRGVLDAVEDTVTTALRDHGLLEPITGEIKSGYAWDFGGAAAGETPATAPETRNSGATAYLAFESMHFGEDAQSPWGEISFDGRFGAAPAMTLVKVTAASGDGAMTVSSQDALAINFGVLWNRPLRWAGPHLGELSVAGRLGTVVLNDLGQVVDINGEKVLAFAPSNGVGRPANVYDLDVEFKLYNNPIEVVHLTKEFKSPMLLVSAGFRHDTRFRADGDLVEFDSPERRLVFRVSLNAVKFFDARNAAEPPKPVTLSFDFEMQSHWHAPGATIAAPEVPTGYRFLIRGDLDILKALSGHKEAPAGADR
jgi:hypothetical protein